MLFEHLVDAGQEPTGEPWCLAFCNTVSSRGDANRSERLKSTEDLRKWLEHRRILSPDGPAAAEDPRNLERAVRLREAIYAIAHALSHGQAADQNDVEELNWNVQRAIVAAKLVPTDQGVEWDLDALRQSVAGSIGLLALSAAALFTSPLASRVRECANDSCGWLFLDLSKNRSRKWCDMADCGNLAKARRYYAKQKALRAAEPV